MDLDTESLLKLLDSKDQKHLEMSRKQVYNALQEALKQREQLNHRVRFLQDAFERIHKLCKEGATKDNIKKDNSYKKNLYCSEHAILRYMERKIGVNTDSLAREIINQMPDTIPFGSYNVVVGNLAYKLSYDVNRTVIATIIDMTKSRDNPSNVIYRGKLYN